MIRLVAFFLVSCCVVSSKNRVSRIPCLAAVGWLAGLNGGLLLRNVSHDHSPRNANDVLGSSTYSSYERWAKRWY